MQRRNVIRHHTEGGHLQCRSGEILAHAGSTACLYTHHSSLHACLLTSGRLYRTSLHACRKHVSLSMRHAYPSADAAAGCLIGTWHEACFPCPCLSQSAVLPQVLWEIVTLVRPSHACIQCLMFPVSVAELCLVRAAHQAQGSGTIITHGCTAAPHV